MPFKKFIPPNTARPPQKGIEKRDHRCIRITNSYTIFSPELCVEMGVYEKANQEKWKRAFWYYDSDTERIGIKPAGSVEASWDWAYPLEFLGSYRREIKYQDRYVPGRKLFSKTIAERLDIAGNVYRYAPEQNECEIFVFTLVKDG